MRKVLRSKCKKTFGDPIKGCLSLTNEQMGDFDLDDQCHLLLNKYPSQVNCSAIQISLFNCRQDGSCLGMDFFSINSIVISYFRLKLSFRKSSGVRLYWLDCKQLLRRGTWSHSTPMSKYDQRVRTFGQGVQSLPCVLCSFEGSRE